MPMAHLRRKDRWFDHARAMIAGSLAKTAALCGVQPRPLAAAAIGFSAPLQATSPCAESQERYRNGPSNS
jgi:hypothetical protein